jgi:hypothetical protein
MTTTTASPVTLSKLVSRHEVAERATPMGRDYLAIFAVAFSSVLRLTQSLLTHYKKRAPLSK